jgi:uncharacterized membrane protein
MTTNRLEAFSDGVIAILITIMVLELRVPEGSDWAALGPVVPKFLAYVLSFVFLGIYWNNHHHLFQVTERVTGAMLWANLHLLFWLSLVPATTGWLSEAGMKPAPVAAYGAVLLAAALAWQVMVATIFRSHGEASAVRTALGSDSKGRLSGGLYVLAFGLAFWVPFAAVAIYVLVAVMWLVPDRRIERSIGDAP